MNTGTIAMEKVGVHLLYPVPACNRQPLKPFFSLPFHHAAIKTSCSPPGKTTMASATKKNVFFEITIGTKKVGNIKFKVRSTRVARAL